MKFLPKIVRDWLFYPEAPIDMQQPKADVVCPMCQDPDSLWCTKPGCAMKKRPSSDSIPRVKVLTGRVVTRYTDRVRLFVYSKNNGVRIEVKPVVAANLDNDARVLDSQHAELRGYFDQGLFKYHSYMIVKTECESLAPAPGPIVEEVEEDNSTATLAAAMILSSQDQVVVEEPVVVQPPMISGGGGDFGGGGADSSYDEPQAVVSQPEPSPDPVSEPSYSSTDSSSSYSSSSDSSSSWSSSDSSSSWSSSDSSSSSSWD